MYIFRHGGMKRLFDRVYASSSLGSFRCSFVFGHVRDFDADSYRFLTSLNGHTYLQMCGVYVECAVLCRTVQLRVDDWVIRYTNHAIVFR